MTAAAPTLAEPLPSAAYGVVRVLFFGRIADVCGRAVEVMIPLGGCSLADLKARLAEAVDGAAEALRDPCVRAAIDQVMAEDVHLQRLIQVAEVAGQIGTLVSVHVIPRPHADVSKHFTAGSSK